MSVSLITTVYNEGNSVTNFLNSYLLQTMHADEFIIIDGGSEDDTAKLVNDFIKLYPQLNIKLVIDVTCSKKYSYGPIARGRNVAIQNAVNDIIAVTDAGCLLDNKWLSEIIRPFEDTSIDIVSGWYKAIENNDFQKLYASIVLGNYNSIDSENFLPSSRSVAFKKKCWEAVGGYPEFTYTAEDTVFDLNLKKCKFRFFFNHKAIVYWEIPKTFDEAKSKHFQYLFGDGQYKLGVLYQIKSAIYVIFPIKLFFKTRFMLNEEFKVRYGLIFYGLYGYFCGFLTGLPNSKIKN